MKTFFYSFAIFVFFIAPLFPLDSPVLAQTTVARWSFDEPADSILIDSSSNGNTGYLHSGTRVPGVKGNALSFNGTSDYAYAKNSSSLNMDSAITIECWVNVRQVNPVSGSGQTFIRKENAYVLGIGSGGRIGFFINVRASWTGTWTLSRQSIQPLQWYHIAGVWNGKTLKTYINGIQDSNTYTCIGAVSSGTFPVYFGEFAESNYEKLNGILDEVRIYDDSLSADLIQAHYLGYTPPTPVLKPCIPNPTYSRRPSFSWYEAKDISVYRLQIAANQGFSTQIISLPTQDTSYTPTVDLPLGILYWRVGNEATSTLWSSVLSIYIQDTTVPILIPYMPDPTRVRRPMLKWWSVKSANAYTIQLFSPLGSTTPFIANAVPDTFYSPSVDMSANTYLWKVKSDLNAMYSIPDTFVILSDSVPILNPMVPDSQTTRRPVFSWSSAEGASYYLIQIDTVGAFANPYISVPVTDTFYTPLVNLPFGRIVWRVCSSVNQSGYSSVDTFWIISTAVGDDNVKGAGFCKTIFSRVRNGIDISVAVDKETDITVTIFSMAGVKVWTRNQRIHIPGDYRISWNGQDKNGTFLKNGNYIVKIKVNDHLFTKKMAIVR